MRTFIDRMRRLFSPRDKRKFALLALLMALSALLETVGIGLLLAAAALFIAPETPAAERLRAGLSGLLPGGDPATHLALLIGGVAALLAVKNLFALGIVRLQSRFIAAKEAELARRLFDAYVRGDSETLAALPPEERFSDLTRINRLCHQVLLPGLQAAADTLVVAALCLTALVLFPLVTAGGAAVMLLAAAAVSRLTRRADRRLGAEFLAREKRENRIRHAGIFGEKAVKCAGAEAFFSAEYDRVYRGYAATYGKLYTLGQIPRLALESAAALAAAGIFCIMLLTGTATERILVIFAVLTAAIARLLPALSRCHYNLTVIRQNLPFLEVTDRLRTLPREAAAPAGPAADAGAEITVEQVDFAYRNGPPVFTGLSLKIPPRSVVALAGRSGRGKTTLAELLLGLLTPRSGRIAAGGVPIANDLAAWRKQIGYVPQEVFILDGTVRENVAFGLPPEAADDAKIRAALTAARLPDFAPGRRVTAQSLSGGQKQRLGIARALCRDAKLLILDEATSALDAATEEEFGAVLDGLRGRVTMLVISHRASTLKHADRIVEL